MRTVSNENTEPAPSGQGLARMAAATRAEGGALAGQATRDPVDSGATATDETRRPEERQGPAAESRAKRRGSRVQALSVEFPLLSALEDLASAYVGGVDSAPDYGHAPHGEAVVCDHGREFYRSKPVDASLEHHRQEAEIAQRYFSGLRKPKPVADSPSEDPTATEEVNEEELTTERVNQLILQATDYFEGDEDWLYIRLGITETTLNAWRSGRARPAAWCLPKLAGFAALGRKRTEDAKER